MGDQRDRDGMFEGENMVVLEAESLESCAVRGGGFGNDVEGTVSSSSIVYIMPRSREGGASRWARLHVFCNGGVCWGSYGVR